MYCHDNKLDEKISCELVASKAVYGSSNTCMASTGRDAGQTLRPLFYTFL